MLAQSTRLLDLGYSRMGSELMKKMLDDTVSSKSDRATELAKLAELNPLEMDFTWETGLQVANILMFVVRLAMYQTWFVSFLMTK